MGSVQVHLDDRIGVNCVGVRGVDPPVGPVLLVRWGVEVVGGREHPFRGQLVQHDGGRLGVQPLVHGQVVDAGQDRVEGRQCFRVGKIRICLLILR